MKRHEAYPSKYMKAADLDGPTQATIRSVSHEAMQDGKVKPIVFFDGFQKGVVVNATNGDVLYGLSGTDDDVDWPGLAIEMYTEMARSPDGKTGPAIRFRVPRRRARAAAPKRPNPDDPRTMVRDDEPPPHTSIPDDLDDAVPY